MKSCDNCYTDDGQDCRECIHNPDATKPFLKDHWKPEGWSAKNPQGCICQKCGKRYCVDFIVSDEIWAKIKPYEKPEGAGLLCGSCIVKGIENLVDFGAFKIEEIK